jgi:quercetin dioxygenase-like cupin family protein
MTRQICRFVLLGAAVGMVALTVWAQGGDETHAANPGQLKFGPMQNLPCLTMAPEHGDPGKGAFTMMLKFTSGCTVPMHWHSSGEQFMMVSGSGKMTADGKSVNVERGGFAYIPAKHQHAFTCVTACTAFLSGDAAFDMHFVDKNGNEIPADQALSAGKPKAAAKKSVM